MAPTDVLRAANAIVGSLGVAPANPAFAGAALGLSAAFSMQGSAGANTPAWLKLAVLPSIANPDGVSAKESERI